MTKPNLEKLLFGGRSAKIAARRRTIAVDYVAPANRTSILLNRVASKPFISRRVSVSARMVSDEVDDPDPINESAIPTGNLESVPEEHAEENEESVLDSQMVTPALEDDNKENENSATHLQKNGFGLSESIPDIDAPTASSSPVNVQADSQEDSLIEPVVLLPSLPAVQLQANRAISGNRLSLIDMDVPIPSNLPAPMAPMAPSRVRPVPDLIAIDDIKMYRPARKISDTCQFILRCLDNYERAKETVPKDNVSISLHAEQSDESFGKLFYSDSD